MTFLRPWNLAVYACIALLATWVSSVAEAELLDREQADHTPSIRDVALVAGDTLRGTVIDAQGMSLPYRTVTISQHQHVAEARSDARGEFRLSGLRGGLYIVAAEGGQQAYRVWAPGTAPPCATDKLLIVGGGDTVRGQLGSRAHHRWLIENAGQIGVIAAFIALPVVYATKPFGS